MPMTIEIKPEDIDTPTTVGMQYTQKRPENDGQRGYQRDGPMDYAPLVFAMALTSLMVDGRAMIGLRTAGGYGRGTCARSTTMEPVEQHAA